MCFTCRFQVSGNFNKKSDVYSFGIILFELIIGRAAIVRGPVKNSHILDWVNPLIERGDVQNIVDPRLEGEFNHQFCLESYRDSHVMHTIICHPKARHESCVGIT